MNASAHIPTHQPPDVQASFCATLVDEWIRGGVSHAVVSPGSRSTPLAIALAARPELALSVVLDERSASFVAIGIARVTKRPVVLLCTSGTAAVEYHPAVVEASLDGVPLLVCTADRPAELHRIGAPQTVVQQGLFGESVRWAFDPGVPAPENMHAWRSIASRALLETLSGSGGPGPVHLNLPFREPLVGDPKHVPEGRTDGAPWHRVDSLVAGSADVPTNTIPETLCAHMSGRKGLFVVGAGGGEPALVHRVAAALGWPVLADARSGCRTDDATLVSGADLLLRDQATAAVFSPEIVVRLGAPWASKVLGQWLGTSDAFDVLVDPAHAWLDPHRHADVVFSGTPDTFCAGLLAASEAGLVKPTSPAWLTSWEEAERAVRSVLVTMIDGSDELSEPAVARAVLAAGHEMGGHLVVASSMPIRDTEWFGSVSINVCVHANRGANGIDGVVSTAVGVAVANQASGGSGSGGSGSGGSGSDGSGSDGAGQAACPVLALLGDLSFLHDASGLVTAANLGAPVTFVVVDNGGGAIFEFLPQATALPRERFEQLFGTPQHVDIANLAEGFGFDVIRVRTVGELRNAVRLAPMSKSGPAAVRVVIVKTDRRANVDKHAELYAAVSAALHQTLHQT